MQQKTANDFDPEVLRLFDQFVHGIIDRRNFLKEAGKYAANGVTAAMLLEMLSPQFAAAQQVAANDRASRLPALNFLPPRVTEKLAAIWHRPLARTLSVKPFWSFMRIAASIRTSKTSPGGWRWKDFWPLRRMRSRL